ncbi:hypothetical protein ACOME3_006926 [Neoechinorhynchus agilis]
MPQLETREIRQAKVQLKELLLYVCFLVNLYSITLSQPIQSMYTLSRVISLSLTETKFKRTNLPTYTTQRSNISSLKDDLISLEQIYEADEFWNFLSGPFFHLIYDSDERGISSWSDRFLILGQNKIVGSPVIRQLRVRNGTCSAQSRLGREEVRYGCFGRFDSTNEFNDVLVKEVPLQRGEIYHSPSIIYEYTEPAYSRYLYYRGHFGNYHDGGYSVRLPVNADVRKRDVLSIFESLRKQKWIDDATRVVFIEFVVHNANVNLHAFSQIMVEMPQFGGARTTCNVNVKQLYKDKMEKYMNGCREGRAYGKTIHFIAFFILPRKKKKLVLISISEKYDHYHQNYQIK